MAKQRAEIGFSSSLEDFNPEEWKPKPEPRSGNKSVPAEDIQKVAKASGFNSREAVAVEEPPPQLARNRRVYRTGRTEQINLKIREEDRAVFYDIANEHSWVLGYTFQRAIEALQRELQAEKKK
ncbi:MAG: stability/partitioning determinant [Candidatus Omnitrophota bacterium]